MCHYHSSCLELTVALVDCQLDDFPLLLHHVCQRGCVLLNYIDFDRAERNFCCDCVDKIWVRVKSDTLKKVGDITVYGMD